MTATAEQETKTFPVLLVEDNPGDARLVVELLSEATGDAFSVTHVEQLADARQERDGVRAPAACCSTSRCRTRPASKR